MDTWVALLTLVFAHIEHNVESPEPTCLPHVPRPSLCIISLVAIMFFSIGKEEMSQLYKLTAFWSGVG